MIGALVDRMTGRRRAAAASRDADLHELRRLMAIGDEAATDRADELVEKLGLDKAAVEGIAAEITTDQRDARLIATLPDLEARNVELCRLCDAARARLASVTAEVEQELAAAMGEQAIVSRRLDAARAARDRILSGARAGVSGRLAEVQRKLAELRAEREGNINGARLQQQRLDNLGKIQNRPDLASTLDLARREVERHQAAVAEIDRQLPALEMQERQLQRDLDSAEQRALRGEA